MKKCTFPRKKCKNPNPKKCKNRKVLENRKCKKTKRHKQNTQREREKIKQMSSELHARTRSSERLENNNNNGMSSSSPTTSSSSSMMMMLSAPRANTPSTTSNNTSATTNKTTNGTVNKMRKSASMLQFSEHAINQVQGLKNRGLDLPVTPRLQRRRYRCAREIVSFFIYLGKLEERRRYPFEALARISRLDNRNTNDK